ncbi:MAG: tyrosine-type recombinase/integrase [Bdellovibrionaceae bacterium]|nr:tyrosine-type recombinase/integrase [Pseudobdellovibrionaceae bacterium]
MNSTAWFKWTLTNFGPKGFVIRRYRKLNGKTVWQSYPKAKYATLDAAKAEGLVKQLNVRFALKAKQDFNHSFINKQTLADFELHLQTKINSQAHIKTLMSELDAYALEFFVRKSNCPDPSSWKRLEAQYGKFLLSKQLVGTYVKRIIQTTNRFIKFLHEKYPEEVRRCVLEPVAGRILKEQGISKKSRNKFVTDEHFKIICEKINDNLLPFVKLCYFYGLRRSEVLGLLTDDVFEDSLSIERQLVKMHPKQYGPLKSREQRVVPHWFCTPKEAYSLIAQSAVVHPDTLGHVFKAEMKRLGFAYQLHDLRRTFITRALRVHHYLDVKLAAGHSDIETTNKYIQDDRLLQRKQFRPV